VKFFVALFNEAHLVISGWAFFIGKTGMAMYSIRYSTGLYVRRMSLVIEESYYLGINLYYPVHDSKTPPQFEDSI